MPEWIKVFLATFESRIYLFIGNTLHDFGVFLKRFYFTKLFGMTLTIYGTQMHTASLIVLNDNLEFWFVKENK